MMYTGSYALNLYRSKANVKPINDIDFVASVEEAQAIMQGQNCHTIIPINEGKTLFGKNSDGRIYECEIAWEGSLAEELMKSERSLLPSLNVLYMLKMSHRYLRNSPHFHKTRNDILEMRAMGAKLPDEYADWYKRRKDATYWYQHPNLDRKKEEFFVDQYEFDHDSIHEAVAIRNRPAYKEFAKPGTEVKSDRKLWEQCSDRIKLCAVVEEASVLALERSIIPFPLKKTDDEAFEFALIKVCTSITSGWFREYAWENYEMAMNLYRLQPSLTSKFNSGLAAGVIRRAYNP